MKEIIIVMDIDPIYSKKFCNQANKLLGKKYNFITFNNIKQMKKYAEDNKVEGLVISDMLIESFDDIKVQEIYLLNEKEKTTRKEGKRTYIYKLQNVKSILDVIDSEISKKYEKNKGRLNESCKLFLYYSPTYIKNKMELIMRIAKAISKKKRVLIVDFEEFDNYKGMVGLSNIIYDYKESILDQEKLMKEIVTDKGQDFIKSVTYPEDFNVITNIDLSNIVNEMTKLNYDYIFVNADMSFVKCQQIFNDADSVVLIRGKDAAKSDKFKSYLKSENQIDIKKVTILDMEKLDKTYLSAFCKQCFKDK